MTAKRILDDRDIRHLSTDTLCDTLALRVLNAWTEGLSAKAKAALSAHDHEVLRSRFVQACEEAVAFGEHQCREQAGAT